MGISLAVLNQIHMFTNRTNAFISHKTNYKYTNYLVNVSHLSLCYGPF
jgi:hypothetical protein